MEFERVWQVFPDGGIARQTELYFKHDTILLKTQSTHSGSDETNYFYSTDEGRNWTDLREELKLGHPISEKYDLLGVLHPLTLEFVKMDRVNDTTTNIYYMNLHGEIHKKVSFPYLADQSGIKLNPIDPDFISLHRQVERMFPFEYQHDVGYSSDRGDNWDYLKPEIELKKQRGINLINRRKIEYKFSPINKGKILFNIIWSDGSNFFYRLTTDYNYIDKSYNFSSRSYSFEHLVCYECFGVDKLTFLNDEEEEFDSFDLNTDEKSTMVFKDRLPFLNSDSLENKGRLIDISKFWGTDPAFFKQNLINNNHKVIYINIRSKYEPENSIRLNYINQLFFQTFDYGKTWELVFSNEDINNQIVDFFIDHNNKNLWILKDTSETDRLISSSWYPILYKSKLPLTSVENQSKDKFKVHYFNRGISVTSDSHFNNASINIYNLSGKLLFNKSIDIQVGENTYNLIQPINEKLILVQMITNEIQIFKLIHSD
jgi:hypothetical protein